LVDADLLDESLEAQTGLQFLYASGVLQTQKERLVARLASGALEESNVDLLKRIKEFRTNIRIIDSLLEMAEQYQRKENDSE
jgi:hypothetical protein